MRTLANLTLTAGLITAFACSGSGKKDANIAQDPIEFEDAPQAETNGGDEDTSTGHLVVSDMTIFDGTTELIIKADGTIEVGGKKAGTITPKGEMLHANGAVLARLETDGTIVGEYLKTEDYAGITIGEDGVLSKGGKPLMLIDEEGKVSVNGTNYFSFTGDAKGRRAAMFVTLIAYSLQKNEQLMNATPAPAGAGATPAPAPAGAGTTPAPAPAGAGTTPAPAPAPAPAGAGTTPAPATPKTAPN